MKAAAPLTFAAVIAALLIFIHSPPARAADADFFEKKVRPILVERCYECHSARAKKVKGGLSLDTRDGLLRGGDNGPAVVPGDPDKSRLVQAVRYADPDLQMPPKGKRLSDEQVADLVAWVKMGAPDPRADKPPPAAPYDFDAARRQWAFRKPVEPPIPGVRDAAWPKSPIDRFILAKLEEKGLKPAKPADRRALIRRATFDLTGLPPTDAEVGAFLADDSPDAFAKVVDRLLASPAYGERWARHWLDVVRYTDAFDARGIGGEADVPAAWRYRDWVVDAFNRDLPYDQFIVHQIAGDLLPPTAGGLNKEGLVATGVYVIGEWGGGDADKEKMLTDIVDDQIDVTGRAFLGLTLACARCHDHKFDPIPTADYYGLAGIFFSSHILPGPGAKTAGSPVLRIPLADPGEVEERKRIEAQIAALSKQIDAALDEQSGALAKELLGETDKYLVAAWEYANRPPEKRSQTVVQFAAERKLSAYALSRWAGLLDKGGSSLKLLSEPLRDVGGVKGLNGWRNPGPSGTPSVTANPTDQPVAVSTLTIPPHRVAVHPSPTNAVAVGWKSPIRGTVRIIGRVIDADPNCGNGIDWRVSVRSDDGVRQLAAGAIPNGGSEAFSESGGGDRLAGVAVHEGDTVEVAVGPKGDFSCDTTVVELTVAERADPKRSWDLSRDVSPDVLGATAVSRADTDGRSGVWLFYERSAGADPPAAPAGSALAGWLKLARSGKSRREEIAAAAEDVRRAVGEVKEKDTGGGSAQSPDAEVYRTLTDPKGAFWFEAAKDDRNLPPAARRKIGEMRAQLDALRKKAAEAVPFAHAIQEGGTPQTAYAGFHDSPILIRGRYDRPGEVVPRHFPRVLAGDDQAPITRGSGRMELARWVASADNPLTARVMVNRIWQHHFGEGIVRTPNNFGKLGTPPTHPELLDWLAVQFVRSGWSVKSMHRTIMLSAAYQQSSVPDPATLKADPENLLIGRMPRQRLEAEALRDALLSVTGQLDRTMGGPAFPDLNTPRRTLYLRTIRSDRSGYRMLFDAADPQVIVDQRTASTVAPQALFLMNSPFVLGRAKALAALALGQHGDERAKIDWLYRRLYARPPREAEVEIGLGALGRARDGADSERVWEQYCQVLLCANEFMYVE